MPENKARQDIGKGLNPGTQACDQRYAMASREWWMPILAYFSVVGSMLLGLLYFAEAKLGPAASLSISTQFHGLPAPFKAKDSVQILTARDAPAPALPVVAEAKPDLQPTLEPPKKIQHAGVQKKKKVAKAAPSVKAAQNATRNRFAQGRGPQFSYGAVW